MAKVREELGELEEQIRELDEDRTARTKAPPQSVEDELGDVLFAVAALGRRLNADPETALRKATARFADRYERMKADARAEGLDLADLSDGDLAERFRAAARK